MIESTMSCIKRYTVIGYHNVILRTIAITPNYGIVISVRIVIVICNFTIDMQISCSAITSRKKNTTDTRL